MHITLKFSIIFYSLALKYFKILDENCLLFVTMFSVLEIRASKVSRTLEKTAKRKC